MKLTPKQARFVEEYLVDLNATQAAIRAGYSVKSAAIQGHENLRKPNIQAAIIAAREERTKRTEITQDYVLKTIRDTIERCAQAAPVLDKKGKPVMIETPEGDTTAAYEFDSMAVLRGAELLGRHLKMFTEKHEVTGKDGKELLPMSAGVLVVPAAMSVEDWEKAAAKAA